MGHRGDGLNNFPSIHANIYTAKSGQSNAEVLRYARQNITQLFCLINLNKETKDLKPKIAGN